MAFAFRHANVFRCLTRGQTAVVRYKSTQAPRHSKVFRKERSFGGGYILLVLPVTAFGLGTWQVQRRKWKLGLIAELEAKTTCPPVPLPVNLSEIEELQYYSVTVRGKFDHSKEMHVGPRSNFLAYQGGQGVQVVTPFILSDRDVTILVNRGWVPMKNKDPKTRLSGQIEDEVEITGIVRANEERVYFMPKENPEKNGYWMYRCVDQMADFAHAAPVFIDANKDSTVPGGPLGGQTRVTLRNEHFSYILTWYTLAAVTFYMWYKRFHRPPPPRSAFDYMKTK